jgi:hypothetical protein
VARKETLETKIHKIIFSCSRDSKSIFLSLSVVCCDFFGENLNRVDYESYHMVNIESLCCCFRWFDQERRGMARRLMLRTMRQCLGFVYLHFRLVYKFSHCRLIVRLIFRFCYEIFATFFRTELNIFQ